MFRHFHFSRFYHSNKKLLPVKFFPTSYYLIPLRPKIFSSGSYSQPPSSYVPPSLWATKLHAHTKLQAKLYFYISLCF
jgi:hypothetical protein